MSVTVMSWVWSNSPTTAGDRLVLLALADAADDSGRNAWPSVEGIAAKARMSERAVRYALRRLEDAGHIVTERNAGPRGCNRYVIAMTTQGANTAGGASDAGATVAGGQRLQGAICDSRGGNLRQQGGQPSAPEPSLTHPDPPISSSAAAADTESPTQPKPERPDVEQVCDLMARAVAHNTGNRPTITTKWRQQARLLLDHDKRPLGEILAVIRWAGTDPFWCANVLSVPKLREKYPQLVIRARQQQAERANPKGRDPTRRARSEDPVSIDELLRRVP